jgi:8-oxo-dGTP diphosphatase
MDNKITVGNVCFILDEETNKVLLLKRNREPMKDQCTGVGGKTHFQEDINLSCIREVKEETGFDVKEVKLKGVIKTILEGKKSSWILFVYTANKFTGDLIDCDEGQLTWVNKDEILSENLIGFIRRIIPHVLEENEFIEGTIVHDMTGKVIEEKISIKLENPESLISS